MRQIQSTNATRHLESSAVARAMGHLMDATWCRANAISAPANPFGCTTYKRPTRPPELVST